MLAGALRPFQEHVRRESGRRPPNRDDRNCMDFSVHKGGMRAA